MKDYKFLKMYSDPWSWFYLFICGLFNDIVSSSDYIMSNDRAIMNNEWDRIWKEAVAV
jgi:hypothetical protein